MKRTLGLLAAAVLAASAAHAAPPFRLPAPVERDLPNGLKVAVLRMPGAGVASVQLLAPAGLVHEPAGQEGVAYVAAELLRHGTTSRDRGVFAAEVERAGGEFTTSVGRDYATVGGTFLASEIATAIELVSDAVRFPLLDGGRMRDVLGQALRVRTLQQGPATAVDEQALRAVFGDHPYGRTPYGRSESLGRLTRESVRAFHAARWAPRGARLVVAGDVDPERVLRAAEEWFGAWSGGGAPAPPTPAVTPAAKSRVIIVDRPLPRAELRLALAGPARGSADEIAVSAADILFGGPPASRPDGMRMRFGREVRSGYLSLREAGMFTVGLSAPVDSAAAAVEALLADLEALHRPPARDALADAVRLMRQTYPLAHETVAQVASAWLATSFSGLPAPSPRAYEERLASLTAEGVAAASKRWLDPQRATIVVAGPAASLEKPLARFGTVEVVAPGALEPRAAQPAAPSMPRAEPSKEDLAQAKQIVQKALLAHGGLARLRGIRDSRVESGVTLIVEGQPLDGVLVQVRQEPRRMVFVSEIGGVASRQTLVGDRAWQIGGNDSVATDLDGATVEGLQSGFSSDLPHLLLAAHDARSRAYLKGREPWDGVDAHAVVVEAPDEPTRTLFFHPQTGRLVGFDQGESADATARRKLSDYREVNGIVWPHEEERLLAGETVMRVHVRNVRLNAGVAKDLFARP